MNSAAPTRTSMQGPGGQSLNRGPQAFPGPPFLRFGAALKVSADSLLREWGVFKTGWLYSYLPRSIFLELKKKKKAQKSHGFIWVLNISLRSALLLKTHNRKGILYYTLVCMCMDIYRTEQKFHKTLFFSYYIGFTHSIFSTWLGSILLWRK